MRRSDENRSDGESPLPVLDAVGVAAGRTLTVQSVSASPSEGCTDADPPTFLELEGELLSTDLLTWIRGARRVPLAQRVLRRLQTG